MVGIPRPPPQTASSTMDRFALSDLVVAFRAAWKCHEVCAVVSAVAKKACYGLLLQLSAKARTPGARNRHRLFLLALTSFLQT